MSFAFAIVVFVLALGLAAFWGYGESMATAPSYDTTPRNILIVGIILAVIIASSHWWPHIGW